MKENLDIAMFFDLFTKIRLNKMNKKIKLT